MAKGTNKSKDLTLVLLGLSFGIVLGQTLAERRAEQARRFRELETSIHELRKKVDPDYKDPFSIGGPIPVKVVE